MQPPRLHPLGESSASSAPSAVHTREADGPDNEDCQQGGQKKTNLATLAWRYQKRGSAPAAEG